MAVNTLWVPVAPEDVWSIVADPRSYAFWVVGSEDVERVEGVWPQVGAAFHHAQGSSPLISRDSTTVLESDPPSRLQLEVRLRPLVVATVTLEFEPRDGGTGIRFEEHPTGGLAGIPPEFLTAPVTKLRNAEAIRRLSAMAWARATGP